MRFSGSVIFRVTGSLLIKLKKLFPTDLPAIQETKIKSHPRSRRPALTITLGSLSNIPARNIMNGARTGIEK